MAPQIFENVLYFTELTARTEVLWLILPLAIATFVMLVYFEKYKEEEAGWNTHVSNSLVLLFVAVALLRYIHSIDGGGIPNYTFYFGKTIVSLIILLLGAFILFLNFGHFLPEKIANILSSPLTLNLFAYILIIFVYSGTEATGKLPFSPENQSGWTILISLAIMYFVLLLLLNLIKIPIKKFFTYLKRMKDHEKVEDIVKEKKVIKEKKKDVKKEEEKLVKSKEELDKEKKEVFKLKKVLKKPLEKKKK